MVCAGVYLLTPSKRAYLRYYKDLEDDILGRRRALQTNDVEALVPEPPIAAERKFAAALSKGMGGDSDEVCLRQSVALSSSNDRAVMMALP